MFSIYEDGGKVRLQYKHCNLKFVTYGFKEGKINSSHALLNDRDTF